MTAEIAILNRSAVALAADSAVTIGNGETGKVFNSVDKLFQCINGQPVGLMVYGSAAFMGIPIETVVKLFRSSNRAKPQPTIKAYRVAFMEFLANDLPMSDFDQQREYAGIASGLIPELDRAALKEAVRLKGADIEAGELKDILPDIFDQIVQQFIDDYETHEDCDSMAKLDRDALVTALNEMLSADRWGWEIKAGELNENRIHKLAEAISLVIVKRPLMGAVTGIVIAGFGVDEIFPSLESVQLCGCYLGTLKVRVEHEIDIGREGANALITPFAQSEMVDRFIDGVDPRYQDFANGHVVQNLHTLRKKLIEDAAGGDEVERKRLDDLSADVVKEISKSWLSDSDQFLHDNFRKDVLETVSSMPKSDLASMAESLVNLTSTKRRVSAERETVGGPADVAVISKGDGFIWIRRKHYFKPELNPRYFVDNRMPSMQSGDRNE